MASGLFRTILVPHDFSRQAEAALETAVDLAAEHGATLMLLHAIPAVYPLTTFGAEPELPVWSPPKELIAEARTRLEKIAEAARKRRGVRGVTCRVLIGEPYKCILEAARAADSIVMATLGRTGLAHLLMGSVAERVVRQATVPVLTLRVPDRGSGGRRPAKRGASTRAGRSGRRAARRTRGR